MVEQTVARLASLQCPRLVSTTRSLQTLRNAVMHRSSKDQRLSNKLGDSYSKSEGRVMLQNICDDSDMPGLAVKMGVESLYLNRYPPSLLLGEMAEASPRQRQAKASKEGVKGFTLCADNVDWVSWDVRQSSVVSRHFKWFPP